MGSSLSRILVCLCVLPELVSCVKDVVMDAGETPQVVVVCILNQDAEQTLSLSYSRGASQREAKPLTEAVAILTDLSRDEEVGCFQKGGEGVWTLAYTPQPSHRYRLDIMVPGYSRITAEQTMPEKPLVEDFPYLPYSEFLASPNGIWEPDEPWWYYGKPNYWYWNDGEGIPLGETYLLVYGLSNPLWIWAMNYNPQIGRREIAEEICTDEPWVDDFNVTGSVYIPPVIDEPIPYQANKSHEGALNGVHLASLYPALEGKALHSKYLRFARRKLEHRFAMAISGSFTGKYNCKNLLRYTKYNDRGLVENLAEDEGFIVCASVSEDYDKYLVEAFHSQQIQKSSDLSTIYLRDNIFTNINGGLGIFGAICERKLQWSGEYTYTDFEYPRYSNSYILNNTLIAPGAPK